DRVGAKTESEGGSAQPGGRQGDGHGDAQGPAEPTAASPAPPERQGDGHGDAQGPAQAAQAAADRATGGAAILTEQGAPLGPAAVRRIDAACDSFEQAWKAGQRPLIEDSLELVPEPDRSALLRELVPLEIAYRRQTGEGVTLDDYRRRYPG